MLTNKFKKNTDINKYIMASDYIYNNFETFTNNIQIKNYINNSTDIIKKYKNIWKNLDNSDDSDDLNNRRIISNIIALNLFILNNYI